MARITAIKPAEQWAAPITTAIAVLCASGLPTRLGLTADDVGTIAFGLMAAALSLRAAWQAWRSGDVTRAAASLEAAAHDERVTLAVETALAKWHASSRRNEADVSTVREVAPSSESNEDLLR